ncbi:MAG TPA: hypothetical protein GX405_15165 [Rhizobiales bacterium]|nr:hypothetical protein [Hyphomicrobiales bacterium]
MADANQLKRIEAIDYGEDDPFAELTRIMGFDPRVPVRPTPAEGARQAAVTPLAPVEPVPASQDDFGFDIDLERELLGGLLPEEEPPVSAYPSASSVRDTPEAAAADLDLDFDAAFALEVGDLDLDLELDRHSAEAAEDDPALGFDEPGAAADAEPVLEEVPMAAIERDDDSVRGTIGRGVTPPATNSIGTSRGPADEDLDFGFDVAMAQVDMDFDRLANEPDAVAGEEDGLDLFDAEAFEQALALDPGAGGGDAADEPEYDAVANLSADAAEETPAPTAYGKPHHEFGAAPVEPVSAAPADVLEDTTLEDELAALLGDPVAPVDLSGRYGSEPLTAAMAAPAAIGVDIERPGGGPVDFGAEPAVWQAESQVDAGTDTAGSVRDAREPVAFGTVDGEDVLEAEYRSDDGSRYFDQAATDWQAAVPEEDGAYADMFDAEAIHAGPDGKVAEETVVDPLAALRSMATDAGRGSVSTPYPGYRSLATPTVSPSSAAARSTYQHQASAQAYSAPGDRSYPVPADDLRPAPAAVDPLHSHDVGAIDDAQFAGAEDGIPEIETTEVPEHAFAVADDLDLPELAFAVDDAPALALDDFERDLAVAYAEPETVEDGHADEVGDLADYADASFDAHPIDRGPEPVPTSVSTAGAAGWSHASVDRHLDDLDFELDAAANAAFSDLGDFDSDDFDERTAAPIPHETGRSDGARRGLLIAAVVGGVAVIGGIGAFALSFGGGSGSSVPVVVRADDTPVKVRPENPGGTVVPNQDNKVYQTVAGGASAPSQEKLISASEEPVDMAAEMLQGPLPLNEEDVAPDQPLKSEDRVQPTADTAATGTAGEVAVVAPRKVRTMVVKPDGSIVPRDEIVEETALAEPQPGAGASAAAPAGSSASTTTGGVPSVKAVEAAPAPVEPAKTKVAKAADAPKPIDRPKTAEAPKPAEKTRTASIPDAGPLAPSRPADQPVEVVGEVKPDQVAATGAGGAWSVQIASQPSEEAAKSTYQDLSRRYANVIGGKGVIIVRAEISGKGTFYRVRVPASSRSDAIALCEQYKAAGGSCFVSK